MLMMDPNTDDLSKDAQNRYNHKYPLTADFAIKAIDSGFESIESSIDLVLQAAENNFQIILRDWFLFGAHCSSALMVCNDIRLNTRLKESLEAQRELLAHK